MSVTSLRPQKIECWGRGDDLSKLQDRILRQPRSLTLVWGDSGIGKTTLLRQLRTELAGPDIHRGLYECQRGGADPLLRCLDSLLKNQIESLGSLETWSKRMKGRLGQVKKDLKHPHKLQHLLKAALSTAAEIPSVGEWATAVAKGLQMAGDIGGAAIEVPADFIPRLGPEVFEDILTILQTAFPGERFVFLIDNLSADAEEAAGQQFRSATDALLSFVETRFSHNKGVHFVLSWKHIANTRPSFEKLTSTVEEYGGDLQELKPIPAERIPEWLQDEFAWFRKATEDERQQVVQLTAGLPQVVTAWKERGVESLDLSRLNALKQDVVKRRYKALMAEVTASEERDLLFQLALMPSILGLPALADLTGRTEQQINDLLEEWRRHALLEERQGAYQFKHETKKEAAFAALSKALVNKGRDSAIQLYNFYLSNVGFSDKRHPEAASYFVAASHVANRANLSVASGFAGRCAALSNSYQTDTHGPFPPLQEILNAPWNTRFALFWLAAARLPATEDLVVALEKNVLERDGAPGSSPLNYAKGLFNASSAYGAAQEWGPLERVLKRLAELTGANPGNAEIALAQANGLVNASSAYGAAQKWEPLERVLDRLAELTGAKPGNAEIALEQAKGLFNASNAYREAQKWEPSEQVLDRLAELAGAYPGSAEIALEQAKGLFNASNAYREAQKWEPMERVLKRLAELTGAKPGNAEIALWLAKGLFNASYAYGGAGNSREVKAKLDALRKLQASRSEHNGIAQTYAGGLISGLRHHFVEPEEVIPELQDLVHQFGETEEFQPVLQILAELERRQGEGNQMSP